MLTFLYTIQFLIAISLIIVVMFQKSEGGTSLVNSNQANNFFSSKSFSTNPLSKITTILGFLLFANCILIAGILVSNKKSDDILKQIEQKVAEKKQAESVKANNANSDTLKPVGKGDKSTKKSEPKNTDKEKSLSVPLAK